MGAETVRIGLLGAARIAPGAVIEPARTVDRARIVAVAARDPRRAAAFAATHGIPHVVDTYRDLVTADHLDAVYIGLPPAAHAPWALAALDAGKHVLCEKPLSCTTSEAAEMVARAEGHGLVLCEAFHWRYHPVADRIERILHDERRIGTIRSI